MSIFIGKAATMKAIIITTDFSESSLNAAKYAAAAEQITRSTPVSEIRFWLERLTTKLLVLNVAGEGKRFDRDITPKQYKMQDLLDGFYLENRYTENHNIADEIEDVAEDHHAGLIITIPKSYRFFEELFHRGVSKRLIRKLDIPSLLLGERK
ncbi:hypothetical protein FM107_02595 [Sphingobacterium sp. JB170]|nr:hypothetical protein FM107_02595 [Sphingobacterium sp. JB170]